MKSVKQSEQIKVTKEDQQSINAFSKHYLKKQELDALIKMKNDLFVQNDDALLELQMMEGKVPTRFGICFFNIETEDAIKFIEGDNAKIKKEIDQLKKQRDDTEKKMKKLKATLYGKFGNTINLQD